MIKRLLLLITLITVFFLVACDCNKCTKSAAWDDLSNVASSEVTFKEQTSDGYLISGKLFLPDKNTDAIKRSPVLLLHMLGQTKETYAPLIPELLDNGYSVLAIDFRGHGESKKDIEGKTHSFRNFTTKDWSNLTKDVDAALKYLEMQSNVDSSEVIIIGGSIGANIAIISSAEHPDKIVKVVALSPGLDYKGVKPGDFIGKSKAQILLIAANDDKYAAESVQELHNLDKDSSKLLIYPQGGHGTNLFTSVPKSINYIIEWLKNK